MTESTKRCRTICFYRTAESSRITDQTWSVLTAPPYQFDACEGMGEHGIVITLGQVHRTGTLHLDINTPNLWLAKRTGRWSVWLETRDNTYEKVATGPVVNGLARTYPFEGFYPFFTTPQISQLTVTLDLEDSAPAPPVQSKLQCRPSLAIPIFTMVDVVFLFPLDFGTSEPYILANIANLETISPYWKRMFASGLQESEEMLVNISGWKDRLQKDLSEVLRQHRTVEGCDQGIAGSTAVQEQSTTSIDDSVRYVVIKDAPKALYEALFEALRVGELQPSAIKGSNGGSSGSECEAAKSVYALAHKLEIEQAQKLAIEAFERCLSPDNALQELMSSNAFLYPDIREAAMKAVLKHWLTIAKEARAYIAKISEDHEVDVQQVLLTALELYERASQLPST